MKKRIIFVFIFLVLAYFFTRLYNLLLMPLFTDEAIYIRWSQIARYDAAWRFISLTDGKQPTFVWLTMILMKFVSNPLLAGRLVSVGAGLLTMIGLFFLAREIFKNKTIGMISSFLYLVFPMALVYDRMALYDSLVGTFAVWSLYLEVLLVRRLRLDLALILGMFMGGGLLTKSSGLFNLYLIPFSLLLFDFKEKNRFQRLLKWVLLAGVAVVEALAYSSILRLSPFFHIIAEKNGIFLFSFQELLVHHFESSYGNLLGLWDWAHIYLTWPVIFLIIFSFFFSFRFMKEKIFLLLWFLVPFIALAIFGKVIYPRFIFFMLLSLLPLVAFSLNKFAEVVKNKSILVLCYLLFLAVSFRTDFLILTNPAVAPIPGSDLAQYLNGWPAGGGINQIIAYLDKQAQKQKIYVASEGTFGSLPTNAVEIYLGENKNVDKRGIWPLPSKIPADLLIKVKQMPVYFIFNQTQVQPFNWPLKLIVRYQKGVGDSYMSLYQVVEAAKAVFSE